MESLQIFADQLHGVDPTALEAVVGPVLRAHAVELVDASFRNERGWVLRFCVDAGQDEAARQTSATEQPVFAEEGAHVTLDQLTEISRDLSAALDVHDIIPHRYSLEVSSPGLDRPLRGLRDFRRFTGRLAKVYLARPAPDGQRVLRGRLVSVLEEGPDAAAGSAAVTLEVDGKPVTVPFCDVARAHLVFEMPGQPKRRPGGRHGTAPGRGKRDGAAVGRPAQQPLASARAEGQVSASPARRTGRDEVNHDRALREAGPQAGQEQER